MSTKGERTKKALLEAAMALLLKRGPVGVTMADVAEATSLTRQAVYLHFPTRTRLMLALIRHVGEHLGAPALFRPVPPHVSAREALAGALRSAACYAERVHHVAIALDLARHTDESARAAWNDRMARRRRNLRKLVRRLHAERALRKEWSIDRVVDALWCLTAPRTYADLVVERRWRLADYERFLWMTAQAFLSPLHSPRRRHQSLGPPRRTDMGRHLPLD